MIFIFYIQIIQKVLKNLLPSICTTTNARCAGISMISSRGS